MKSRTVFNETAGQGAGLVEGQDGRGRKVRVTSGLAVDGETHGAAFPTLQVILNKGMILSFFSYILRLLC